MKTPDLVNLFGSPFRHDCEVVGKGPEVVICRRLKSDDVAMVFLYLDFFSVDSTRDTGRPLWNNLMDILS